MTNPIDALARILAGLHDPDSGRVTIPGFYDNVREPSATEREQFARVPFRESEFRAKAGAVPPPAGSGSLAIVLFMAFWSSWAGPGRFTRRTTRPTGDTSTRTTQQR